MSFLNARIRSFLLISLIFSLFACGGSSSNIATKDLVLASLFPTNGANWNDYVTGDASTATDVACNALTDTACLHGGEIRVVEATGKTSCSGLTAEDKLAAFNWVCNDGSGTAQFVSTGLADGKNLSDLIDFGTPAFKLNAVTVFNNGSVYGKTPEEFWWSNPVEISNAGGSLDTASTIYLATVNPATKYTFNADKVALVIQPGLAINGAGLTNFVVIATGFDYIWIEGSVDATGDSEGVTFDDVRFSRLRNVTVTNASGLSIHLKNNSDYNSLQQITVTDNGTGIFIADSSDNSLTDITASSNSSNGIVLNTATDNALSRITASNNVGFGISISSSSVGNVLSDITVLSNNDGVSFNTSSNNNVISRVFASNNSNGVTVNNSANNSISDVSTVNNNGNGIFLSTGSDNTLSNITSANNQNSGIGIFTSSNNNRLSNITVSANATEGVVISSSLSNTLTAVTATNNASFAINAQSGSTNTTLSAVVTGNNSKGLLIAGGSDNTVADLVSANNTFAGVTLSSTSNNTFTGLLEIGSNSTACSVVGGTLPGLDDTTCANNGGSDASLIAGVTLSDSFIGKVTSNDSQNADDTNGSAASFPIDPAVFDWTHFDNSFRTWGVDGSLFPNFDQRVRWTTGAGGRIWDWSTSTTDSGNAGNPVLQNVIGTIGLPTGNDTLTHVWDGTPATADDPGCDALIPGSVLNGAICQTTYLRNAVEIQGDELGNENTLCESGETCLFMPNIGSYQGHGSLISAGAFVDGTLTGITLMQYDTNGR